ncbi:MAG: choice-of-anchor B family protein [Rhodothermales bacterium]|nr:choice-of-anchor B family protein [Rhodothermales bacterium]MBO6780371.1 choice-of-anchor B family protein [Rhodothermales bacterium]
MKRLSLLFLAVLIAPAASAQYALQFGASVAVSGDDVIVGEGRNLLLPGTAYVFSPAADGTYELSARISANTETADGYGRALAADDETLVVGAPQAMRVYVHRRGMGPLWEHIGTIESDVPGFGAAVAYSDGHLLVGAPGERGESGQAFAFHSGDGVTWTETGRWQAPEPAPNDRFGGALAISGDLLAIGAPGIDERAGAVFSARRESGSWSEPMAIRHPAGGSGDSFGASLMIADGRIGIGAPGRSVRSGEVTSWSRDGSEWVLESTMRPFVSDGSPGFGTSIAMAGDHFVAGAPGTGAREGAVHRFTAAGAKLLQPDALQFRSGFGAALAGNESVLAVGANGQDNFEGAAFIYSVSGAAWSQPQMVWYDSGKFATVTGEANECEDDTAGGFACSEVDMLSFLTREDVGARRGIQMSDVWGWEDPETGSEYALIGRTDGTSIVDLTDPYNPVYLGDLPLTSTANQSLWRDIKVYRDHAYVVADGAGAHHMQILDLTQLRDLDRSQVPVTFTETNIYKGVFSSHNIVINEESGFAYAVGSDSGGESCGGALHMIDLSDPANPEFAGCFADRRTGRGGSGATHDAQCVNYRGPDVDYQGREICLSSNGTALSIADVTDKSNPTAISMADYPNVAYTHQGWFDDEHRYFYLNDEGDEVSGLVDFTRTLIFDLTDLEDPVLAGEYLAETSSIDHNLYVKGDIMYQTNYQAGLRIVDISDRERPVEVGYFDTVPYGPNDSAPVLGAWSNYPYFKSGVIVVTSGREGVFFLKRKTIDT